MGRGSKQNSSKQSTSNAPVCSNNPTLKIDADESEIVECPAVSTAARRQQGNSKASHTHLTSAPTSNGAVRDDSESSSRPEGTPSPSTPASELLSSANQLRPRANNTPLVSDVVLDDDTLKLQQKMGRGACSPSFRPSAAANGSAANVERHDSSSSRALSNSKQHVDSFIDNGTAVTDNLNRTNSKRYNVKAPAQAELTAETHQHSSSHHHRPLEHMKSNGQKESEEDSISECPLCLEIMDTDDLAFYPCTVCAYQICRFCWHRIVHETDATGETQCTVVGGAFCPNCRSPYDEQATLRATQRRIQLRQQQQHALNNGTAAMGKTTAASKLKQQANGKNMKQPNNFAAKNAVNSVNFPSLSSPTTSGISNSAVGPHQRQPSINCRVVLKNLLFVQGVPVILGHFGERWVRNLFERFGHVEKVIFTHTNSSSGDAAPTVVMSNSAGAPGDVATATIKGVKGDTCGAFITYINYEHALESLVALNNYSFRLSETDLQDIVATAKTRNAAPLKPWTPKERKDLCDKTYQMRVFLGTSKYCQNYLNGKTCMRRPEAIAAMLKQNNRGKRSTQTIQQASNVEICHYMHDSGDLDAIFTKEEITIGMHLRYQQRLINHYLSRKRLRAAAAAGGVGPILAVVNGVTVPTAAAVGNTSTSSSSETVSTFNRVFEQQQQMNVRVPVGMPAAAALAAQAAVAAAAAAAASKAAAAAAGVNGMSVPTILNAKSSSTKSAAPPTAWAHPTLSVSKLFNNISGSSSSKVTVIKPAASSNIGGSLFLNAATPATIDSSLKRLKGTAIAAGGAWGGDGTPLAANINNLEEFPPVLGSAANNIMPSVAERNSGGSVHASTVPTQQLRPSSSYTANSVISVKAVVVDSVPATKKAVDKLVPAETTSGSTTPASSRPASSGKRPQQPGVTAANISNTATIGTGGSNNSSHRGSTTSVSNAAATSNSGVVVPPAAAATTPTKAVVKKISNKSGQPRVAPAPAAATAVTLPASVIGQQQNSPSGTPATTALSQVVGRDSGCCSSASAESPLPIGTAAANVGASAVGPANRSGGNARKVSGVPSNSSRLSGSTLSSTSSSLSSLFPAALSSPPNTALATTSDNNTPTSAGSNNVFADKEDGCASVPPMMSSSGMEAVPSVEQQQQAGLFHPLQVAASAAYDAYLSPNRGDHSFGSGISGPITINSNNAVGVRTVSSSSAAQRLYAQLSIPSASQHTSTLFADLIPAAAAPATTPTAGTSMPTTVYAPLFGHHQSIVHPPHHFGMAGASQHRYQQQEQSSSYRASFAENSSMPTQPAGMTGPERALLNFATSSQQLVEPRRGSSDDKQEALAVLCRSLNINSSSNSSGQFRQNVQQQQQRQRLLSANDTVVPLDYCDAQSIEQYVQQQQQRHHEHQQLMSHATSTATSSMSTMINNTPPPLFVNAGVGVGVGSGGGDYATTTTPATLYGGSVDAGSRNNNSVNLLALSSSQMTPPWSIAAANSGTSSGIGNLSNNSIHETGSGLGRGETANNAALSQHLLYGAGNRSSSAMVIPSDEFQRHQWLLQQHQQEQEQQRLLLLRQQHAAAEVTNSFNDSMSYPPSLLFDRGVQTSMVQLAAGGAVGLNEHITMDADVFRSHGLLPSSASLLTPSRGAVRSNYNSFSENTHDASVLRHAAIRDDALDGELGFDPWAVSHDALSSMIGAAAAVAAATTSGALNDTFDHQSAASINNIKLPSQTTSSPLLDFMSMRCNYHQTRRQQRNKRIAEGDLYGSTLNDDNDVDDDDYQDGDDGGRGNEATGNNSSEGIDAATLLSLPQRNNFTTNSDIVDMF